MKRSMTENGVDLSPVCLKAYLTNPGSNVGVSSFLKAVARRSTPRNQGVSPMAMPMPMPSMFYGVQTRRFWPHRPSAWSKRLSRFMAAVKRELDVFDLHSLVVNRSTFMCGR